MIITPAPFPYPRPGPFDLSGLPSVSFTPTPGPSVPGSTGCPAGEVYVEPGNALNIPGGCYPNSPVNPGVVPSGTPNSTRPRDSFCVTTHKVPGGRNPVTGQKYPATSKGFCCEPGGCITWKHVDASGL